MADFSSQDKFNKSKNFTQVKFGADATLLEVELNEMQKILNEARADITREMVDSGVLSVGKPNFTTNWDSLKHTGAVITEGDYFKNYPNTFGVGSFQAIINGYKLPIFGGNKVTPSDDRVLIVELPKAPTFGYREDLVLLEAWFEEITAEKDSTLIDARMGVETSRRVKLNWRIRTVAGVDFSKGESSVVKDGTATTSVDWDKTLQPLSSLGETISYNSSNPTISGYVTAKSTYAIGNKNLGNTSLIKDSGLWVAGDGTQASKDLLKTVDGYMYAIPLFRVKRRNTSEYSESNPNGAKDSYTTSSYSWSLLNGEVPPTKINNQYYLKCDDISSEELSKFKSGDLVVGGGADLIYFRILEVYPSSKTIKVIGKDNQSGLYGATNLNHRLRTSSGRPDDKYASIIYNDDIIDLRHKVSLTGVNYQQVFEEAKDKLLRGELFTKEKPVMTKEIFGLEPAPLGVQSQLMPTKVLGNDGVERELVNLLGNYKDNKNVVNTSSISTGTDYLEYVSNRENADFGFHQIVNVDTSKYYLLQAEFISITGNSGGYVLWVSGDSNFTRLKRTDITKNTPYRKVTLKLSPSEMTSLVNGELRVLATANSGGVAVGDKLQIRNVSLYEVDKATHDLINVDPNFTGEELVKKFPYISSYPNIITNPISLKELFDSGFTVTDTTGTEQPNHGVTVSMEGNNLVISNTAPYNRVVRFKKVLPYTNISPNQISLYNPNGGKHTSLELTRVYGDSTLGIQIGSANSGVSKFTLYTITINQNFPVPYGRWLLPRDYANGDTPLRLQDFQGALQRGKWSDAQSSESVTDIIDPISNSHLPHISVYQRTANQWTVGDSFTVKSKEGIVMGIVDSDTALAYVTEDMPSQVNYPSVPVVKVNDVSKFTVNNTVVIYRPSINDNLTVPFYPLTITAIDIEKKTITLKLTGTTYTGIKYQVGDIIADTTASISSPVVTATGLVGNWTGLGTKEATFTITTAPTTNTAPIKVDYTVVYPAGKGLGNLPAESLEATVNGDRHVKASDNIVRIKANFKGKTLGYTDLVPHITKSTHGRGSTALEVPTSSKFFEPSIVYPELSNVDDSLWTASDNSANGVIAQQLFSFNIIRMIEDKLGEGVFADCVTLADKVAKADKIFSIIRINWYGFGSSPLGNKAILKAWHTTSNSWVWDGTSNTVNYVTKLAGARSGNGSNVIDANGFSHFLVYAEASDGTTPSVINTDYVELELELNVAETGYDVLIPENPFPILEDDPSRFKEGENMIQTFYSPAWTIHTNAVINSEKSLTLNATANGDQCRIPVKVLPNTNYRISAKLSSELDSFRLYVGLTTLGYGEGMGQLSKTYQSVPFNTGNNTLIYVVLHASAPGSYTFEDIILTPTSRKEVSYVPYNKNVKRKKKLDFLGKFVGSSFENPHRFAHRDANNFSTPTIGSNAYVERTQGSYDIVSKSNGTLSVFTASTPGNYAQHVFEFDLSHLGLSLTEIKSALRKLTVRWTGYGEGDNAGVLGYGVTGKVWVASTNSWALSGGLSSTSQTVATSASSFATPLDRWVTNDQKIYVLVHTTYPASSTNPAKIYTDYVALEVEMADYVDYVKGNVVKVRKETKELKLQYPKKSFRTGKEDVVNLWYKAIPYQGIGKSKGKIVYMDNNFTVLTFGTGKYDSTLSSIYNNASSRLPKSSGTYKDHDLLLDPLIPIFGVADTRIMAFPVNAGTRTTGLTSVYYSEAEEGNSMYSKDLLYANMPHLTVLAYLVFINGELRLKVKASYSTNNVVSNAGTTEIDDFLIEGRPLVKGVN